MSKAMTIADMNRQEVSFESEADLTIRNRVAAMAAALDIVAANAPIKDDLMAQFAREIEDLQAQLGQVEKQFGKNTPMAGVLRDALESARCRLETRRIELEEETEKKPALRVVQNAPEPHKVDELPLWLLFLLREPQPMLIAPSGPARAAWEPGRRGQPYQA